MIVKKYRLNLGERNILSKSDGQWLTKEERRTHDGHCFAYWLNDTEFFTKGQLLSNFEEYFGMDFPLEWEEKIVELEYDIPEGEFVITQCFPDYNRGGDYLPNRNLYRHCKSVREVLDYLGERMETFRVVLGQFKLEKPLTTLYVVEPYVNKRRWKYPGT